MRVIVTGGAGFVGSHIVDEMVGRGHEVAVIDDLSNGRKENINPKVAFYNQDIRRMDALRIIFGQFKPDVVSHQAAQPSLRLSVENPAADAEVNIIGTLNVMQAARQFDVKHFVFASTSAVYDPETAMHNEEDERRPNLPYGIAKAAAEQYLIHSGGSYTVLRYGNVYGPRQRAVGENQLIPHALMGMLDGGQFAINGDGYQTREFVYVGDIARANRIALERQIIGLFNVGTGSSHSVNRVCNLLKDLIGWTGEFAHAPGKVGEARDSVLDSYNAKRHLGWTAETALADGLKKTVEAWGK